MEEQAPCSVLGAWVITPRNPAHADPEWYQRDLDDQIEDPDVEPVDPFPTERHWRVPGF